MTNQKTYYSMSSTWGRTEIFDFEVVESNSNSFLIFYQVQPLSLALSLGERTSFGIYVQDRSRNKVRDDKCWWHLEKHVIAHHVARSVFLYFLYPSLKFLSSHNSLRNFFSPSRGEIKMFRLTKLKISTIFLNKSNFLFHA